MAVAKAIDSAEQSSDAVAKLIGKDLVLTARVLKVANSSFYGMTGRIGTVRDALVILGFSTVGNLVVAMGFASRYASATHSHAGLRGFWQHGMLVAACAASLARRSGAEEGVAYVGGLLHDIGKLVLASAFPHSYGEPVPAGLRALHGENVLAIERARFGTDHAALGGLVAGRWRYPDSICAALRDHHSHDPQASLAKLIACADRVAHAFEQAGYGAALQAGADALVELESNGSAPDLIAEIDKQAGAAALLLGTAT